MLGNFLAGALAGVLALSGVAAAAQAPERLPPALENVGFDQRLDAPVPLHLAFRDETGESVRLGDYLGKRPAILVLVQYRCPMLCNQILNGLTDVLGKLSFELGDEFDVVTVSFDAREQTVLAAAKKTAYVERLDRVGAERGWHFLTGDQAVIDELTQSVGFRFVYDAEHDRFAHPSGLVVLTPQGKIGRYFFGVDYSPRDLRLGLVEASQNKIGTAVDQVMLFCYGYDPKTGKYSVAVMNVLRAGGAATVFGICLFIWRARVRQVSRSAAPCGPTTKPATRAAATQ